MRHYNGDDAKDYEKRRIKSKTWQFEDKVVADIIMRHRPVCVFDSPVGTGRFFSLYKQIGCDVVGIDISADMLAMAKDKGYDYELIQGDIFDFEFNGFVVCMRFWGHLEKTQQVLLLEKVKGCLLLSHRTGIVDMAKNAGLKIVESYSRGRDSKGEYYVSLLCR